MDYELLHAFIRFRGGASKLELRLMLCAASCIPSAITHVYDCMQLVASFLLL